MDTFEIRKSNENDFDSIKNLNDNAFPAGSLIFEAGAVSELQAGIQTGRTFVLESSGSIFGFYQYDVFGDSHIEFVSIIVHESFRSDETHKGKGYGQALLSHFLLEAEKEKEKLNGSLTISVVTSMDNVRMLSLLIKNNFSPLRVIPNYFGPGKDRVYCEYGISAETVLIEKDLFVPVTAKEYIASLLNGERYISKVINGAQGAFFEIKRFEP